MTSMKLPPTLVNIGAALVAIAIFIGAHAFLSGTEFNLLDLLDMHKVGGHFI